MRLNLIKFDSFDGILGADYHKEQTNFRLWSPIATKASVKLYPDGEPTSAKSKIITMEKFAQGVWSTVCAGDLKNVYYTYVVTIDNIEYEAVDPYAKAAGVNGKRGMVVDLAATNPAGWEGDLSPDFAHPTDAVIYELHIRDFSISEHSGMVYKGKYLAFTEENTESPTGLKTGIAHLCDLGVTHVHLLPCFDFISVDEAKLEQNAYNWGYDPGNYNLPEGSYATDPHHGSVRITEFKKMVQSLHKNGLRVVMDVVYNHTGRTEDSDFEKLVPNYYYRKNKAGNFMDGSGCGNETASERSMVRKFMIDSLVYWATEYHIDGFRFDLMALHDIETMNAIRDALFRVNPSILLYGEGWTGQKSGLPDSKQASKKNVRQLKDIAVFSDDIRNAVKGGVFEASNRGFVSGNFRAKKNLLLKWEPSQTVVYASCHDNLALWDKLKASCPAANEKELIAMNKLSALLVLTSQGIPFFQAGEEFARTKFGDENSYKSPDSTNRLSWERKAEYAGLYEYYRGLIAIRKAHPAFRLRTFDEIRTGLFVLPSPPSVFAYALNDSSGSFIVALNAGKKMNKITLPSSGWHVLVNQEKASVAPIDEIGDHILVMPPQSGFILQKK